MRFDQAFGIILESGTRKKVYYFVIIWFRRDIFGDLMAVGIWHIMCNPLCNYNTHRETTKQLRIISFFLCVIFLKKIIKLIEQMLKAFFF